MAAGSAVSGSLRGADGGHTDSLGLVIHSFMVRTAGDRDRRGGERFSDPIRFLEHARSLGARGVQVGLGVRDEAGARAVRERAEAASMYLEGIAALPRDDADLDRFEAELRTAGQAGARVVRTVMLSGRRYETFPTAEAFRRFAESSSHSLKLAAPVAARHGILLAVENHKDWRADELLAILKRVGNDHVGVCLDTGNSIALLEDPMDVIEALAPRSFTTHFKDMGLEEYREGFLLAEVPLGTGVLDLPRAVRILQDGPAGYPLQHRDDHPRPAPGAVPRPSDTGRPSPICRAGTSPGPSRWSAIIPRAVRCRGSATCRATSSSAPRTRTSGICLAFARDRLGL